MWTVPCSRSYATIFEFTYDLLKAGGGLGIQTIKFLDAGGGQGCEHQ